MKSFFRSGYFKILLAVAVILVGIMIGNATSGRQAALPSSFLSTLVSPFQTVGAILKNGVGGVGDYFRDQQGILDENRQLREEIAGLRKRQAEYEEYKRQNEMYRQMLEIRELRPDFKMVEAIVTVRQSEEYYSEFSIGKGSLHGIKVKDPVVTGDGLVGYVNEVGLNYAKVTTLFSPSANVGGYDVMTHDFGVVTGGNDLASQGLFKMAYLPKDSLVSVDNIITTSGLGGGFPTGLTIGVVQKVVNASQGVTLEAVLTPAVDFSALRNVMVITSFELREIDVPAPSGSGEANGSGSSEAEPQ